MEGKELSLPISPLQTAASAGPSFLLGCFLTVILSPAHSLSLSLPLPLPLTRASCLQSAELTTGHTYSTYMYMVYVLTLCPISNLLCTRHVRPAPISQRYKVYTLALSIAGNSQQCVCNGIMENAAVLKYMLQASTAARTVSISHLPFLALHRFCTSLLPIFVSCCFCCDMATAATGEGRSAEGVRGTQHETEGERRSSLSSSQIKLTPHSASCLLFPSPNTSV